MISRRSVLPLLGLLLLSVNLRPVAASIGPVLQELREALAMSPAEAGLLTSLPVLAFAVFGVLAPAAARRVGVHRVTLLALLAVVAGLSGRATTHSKGIFFGLTLLALAGMAMANVLMPALVKLHFPDRIGTMTAIYTTGLSVGLTAALTFTIPIGDLLGSWRWGLGAWSLVAVVAVLPWTGLIAHDRTLVTPPRAIRLGDVAKTRLGWAMALFFGLQSTQAYSNFGWFAQLWRDNGYSAGRAGLLVGLIAAMAIPFSLWAPAAVARRTDPRLLILVIMSCYPLGYVLLLVDPHLLALPAAVLIGIGAVTFPIVLTLIGLRTRTPDGTTALSGFAQPVGYLIAAVGPMSVGALYDLTGGWVLPLWLLIGLTGAQIAVGLYASRPAYLEDQLR